MALFEGERINIYPDTDIRRYKAWITDEGFTCRVYSDHILIGARFKHRKFKAKALAKLVQDKREQKGWNRHKLARMVNVSENTIFNWEVGITQPKPFRLKELMEVLDITEEEIERCRI